MYCQNITINLGVDTTDIEIKAVVSHWMNYMKSKPTKESIKNSKFWGESENKRYNKVDQLLYSYDGFATTYEASNETIFYLKPRSDFYELKTMFSESDSLSNVTILYFNRICEKRKRKI